MSKSDELGDATRLLSADACDRAIDQGKVKSGQNLGVIILRVVMDGVNAEDVKRLRQTIEFSFKGAATLVHPQVKYVDSSSNLIGAIDAPVDPEHPEQMEETMREVLQASGAVDEDQMDQLVQAAREEVSAMMGRVSSGEPVSIDEYLDAALVEVNHPILGR